MFDRKMCVAVIRRTTRKGDRLKIVSMPRVAWLVILLAFPFHAVAQPIRGGALPRPLPLFPLDNWWNTDVGSAPLWVANG